MSEFVQAADQLLSEASFQPEASLEATNYLLAAQVQAQLAINETLAVLVKILKGELA